MNIEVLSDILDAVTEESREHTTTISVLEQLAGDGLLSRETVELVEEALRPIRAETHAIYEAVNHARACYASKNMPQLPFAKAPAPLTDEETKLLNDAHDRYFNC